MDTLPAKTQVGANTFGCLVNGKAIKPTGISLTPTLQCYYQNLHGLYRSEYFFGLHAIDHSNPENFPYVGLLPIAFRLRILE